MYRIFTTIFLVFFSVAVEAQTQTLAYQWDLSIGDDSRVVEDANGNLFVFGAFSGTTDLDPGAPVVNYTPPDVNFSDGYIVKLNSAGVFQWAKVISGNGGESVTDIAIDVSGNLLVTVSMGSYYVNQTPDSDLDPGSGTYNVSWTSIWGAGALVKLDAAGNFIWAKTFIPEVTASSYSYASIIKVNVSANNEIYLAGQFNGTLDLNPDAGVSIHTSPTSSGTAFLARFDALGNFIWVDFWERESSSFGGSVQINDIAIDLQGNAFILATGANIDADPGVAVQSLPFLLHSTAFVIKVNADGAYQWANQLNPMNGQIAGSAIALDNAGSVFITGNFTELVDLNFINRFANGGTDIFIMKLNSSDGNFTMLRYVGGINDDGGTDIFIDSAGYIFSAGYFGDSNGGTIDLNPQAAVNNLTSFGGRDNYLWILSPTGSYVWSGNVGSNGANEYSYGLVPGLNNSVFLTGSYDNSSAPATAIDFDPNPGIAPNTTKGGFVVKYSISSCTSFAGGATSVLNNVSCYNGTNGSATITQLEGGSLPYYYQWNSNPVQTTQTLVNVPAGSYTATATDAAGCIRTAAVTITQPQSALSNVTASVLSNTCSTASTGSATVTAAQGGTPPYSYTWNTNPVQSGQLATGLPAGNYTVTAADAYGCTLSASANVSAYPNPEAASVCMVSVDSTSEHNVIYWDKTPHASADSFIIYRETNLNSFQRIAAISADSLSMFVDTVAHLYPSFTGNPNLGTNRYKLQVVDTCGNYAVLGNWHKTIFVNQTGGVFTFNDYSIQGQPVPLNELSSYQLWRDDNSSGNWQLLSSNASSPMNDPDFAMYPNASWCIKTVWSISCSPTRTYEFSQSNILSNEINGLNEQGLKPSDITVSPNPATDVITINSSKANALIEVDVLSVTGSLLATLPVSGKQSVVLPVSDFADGIYVLRINTLTGPLYKKVIVK